MCVSFARKAQALIHLRYPSVRLRVHPIGLTPDQSQEWGLPSTPLKDTEKRARDWIAAMGTEQTEIDAAIARAPAQLEAVIAEACLTYFDTGLQDRIRENVWQWYGDAKQALTEQLGEEMLSELHSQLGEKLSEIREKVAELYDLAKVDAVELGVKLPSVPAVLTGLKVGQGLPPLIDTIEGFVETTLRLKARKAYR